MVASAADDQCSDKAGGDQLQYSRLIRELHVPLTETRLGGQAWENNNYPTLYDNGVVITMELIVSVA